MSVRQLRGILIVTWMIAPLAVVAYPTNVINVPTAEVTKPGQWKISLFWNGYNNLNNQNNIQLQVRYTGSF